MDHRQSLWTLLNIKPVNINLYDQAFTHSSFNLDINAHSDDYERLEFIGDAVLQLLVAHLIYQVHHDADQGTLTKIRAKLVSTESLSSFAKQLSLAQYVLTGPSLSKEELSKKDKILENVFEALIGAIFLDCGYDKTVLVVDQLFYDKVKNINLDTLTDFKTKLQEFMQGEHREAVVYAVEKESGPAHNKYFTVTVSHDGTILGRGRGKSKKEAEQKAAEDACLKIAGK